MGTGYTRNDTLNNIADGNIINASDLDGEFDAVESAFNESTGHTHDGTAAEGAPVTVLGPVQDFIASATEIKPKTTNTLDIGTVSLQFKDMYLDGTAYLDDIQAVGAVDITGDLDVDNININGNTISSTDTNGNITLAPDGTGVVNLTDNDKLTFGDGNDLQIYHSGVNSFISDAGTGDLFIQAQDLTLRGADASTRYLTGVQSTGAVTAFYGNAAKFATTNTGVDVTGQVDVNSAARIDSAGIVKAANGSAAAPTHAFLNDPDNGMFRATTNTIGFSTAGSEAMRIDSSGNVGIGTSSPSSLLHIEGASAQLRIEASSGNSQINFADTADANIGILAYDHSANAMTFRVNDSERMRIDSSGNLGIGTTSPSYPLEVNASSGQLILAQADSGTGYVRVDSSNAGSEAVFWARATNTGNSVLQFGDPDDSDVGWIKYEHSNNAMAFRTNASEAMRIDSDGKVNTLSQLRVGGTTDETALSIINCGLVNFRNSNTPSGERFQLDCEGTATAQRFRLYYFDGTNYRNRMTIAGNNSGETVFNDSSQDIDFRVESNNDASAFFINGADGSVGIGSSSTEGNYKLDVRGWGTFTHPSGDCNLKIQVGNTTGFSVLQFGDTADTDAGYVAYNHASNYMSFRTNGSGEDMRITSGGDLLVGTTDTTVYANSANTNADSGINIRNDGKLDGARYSGIVLGLNRTGTDGTLLEFRRSGSVAGEIGAIGGDIYVGTGSTTIRFTGSDIRPTNATGANNDNVIDLGDGNARFDDVFATNGTIQTSDANEKQQIAALTDAEITAAKAISQLFKTFKWNSAVEAKGDAARTHTGVIAQDVEAAMTAAGLDAGDYAFFISTTWWETQTEVPAVDAVEAVDAVYEDVVIPAVEEELDEDGNVIVEAQPERTRTEQRLVSEAVEAVEAVAAYTRTDTYDTAEEAPEGATERNRKGIRYPELLAFVGAATEQRLANIETRLAALEAN